MSKLLKNSSKGKSPLLGGGILWTLKQMSLHLLLPSCKACGHAAWTCTVVRGTVWGCWAQGAAGVQAGTTVVVAPQSCMADCSCFTLSCPTCGLWCPETARWVSGFACAWALSASVCAHLQACAIWFPPSAPSQPSQPPAA